jgi:hypothetical protein
MTSGTSESPLKDTTLKVILDGSEAIIRRVRQYMFQMHGDTLGKCALPRVQ